MSAWGLITERLFRLDYLMPAELFPATLLGCLLLYFIDRRIKTHQKYIGWTFLAAVILFFGTQGLAVVTGAANAEADAVRWYWVLMVGIILFDLALILVGVGGILQLKQLFRPAILPSPTKDPV